MYIKWNLTKKCTLNCKFCHNAAERKHWHTDTTIDQMDVIIKNIANTANLEGISLLGGDPLEYKHILPLTERLLVHHVPFGFITAGEEIYTGKYDSILFNGKLKFIGLSIDSLNPDTVRFVRNKDMLHKQLKSLNHILELKEKYHLSYEVFTNTILMNVNQHEMIDLIKYFKQKQINKIQILEFKHTKHALHDFSITFEEELDFLDQLSTYIQLNNQEDFSQLELCFLPEPGRDYLRQRTSNNQISVGTSSICPIFRDTVFVSNDGFVYPCDNYKPYFKYNSDTDQPYKVYTIENMVEQDLNDTVRNNDYFKDINHLKSQQKEDLFKNLEPCNECKYLLEKCYPCLQYSLEDQPQTYVYEKKCKFYMEHSAKCGELV